MAYLERKSGNNQQDMDNNQSVELNTEAVQQLDRLLNLLTDLDLINVRAELTEESIKFKPEEQRNLLTTETNEREKNQNYIHQTIIKDSAENDNDLIDNTIILGTGKKLLFQPQTSNFKPQSFLNNLWLQQSAIPEPVQYNFNFIPELTEKFIESEEQKNLLSTENNETEKNQNLIPQSITKDSAEDDHDVINIINHLAEFPEEFIESEEQKNLLSTENNETEKNQNLIPQSIRKDSAEDDHDVVDIINYLAEFPEEFIESEEQRNLLSTETNETEKNQNSIPQSITKNPAENDHDAVDIINRLAEFPEEFIESEEQKNLLSTETNETEKNQSIRKDSAEDDHDVVDIINHLAEFPEEFIESEEQRNLLSTETNETEKNQNSIPQNITEYSSQNYDSVESESPDNQKEIPTREKQLFIQKESSELSVGNQQDDGGSEAFETLQNTLLGSETAQLIRKINTHLIKQKVDEHPDDLSTLFTPVLLENLLIYLGQKEGKNQEAISSAIAEVIAPMMDIIITKKIEQNQESIIGAIAPLLAPLISYEIQNYPQQIAKALGPEMGAAIQEQARVDRGQISQALAPEMGTAIKEQVFLERNSIVDALYPVIGSTISKYMTETIREIDNKISETLSYKVIKRKVQAKLQGVSEAELILSEITSCTVKAVFLIHKESGLVIAEAQESGPEKLESEMVAGMLTAIRSFVNDCIVQSGDISELNEIEYGDSKIILEVAGHCYLTVVIKGEPNKSFIKKLRQTLSKIVIDYGKDIKNFAGDPDTIPSSVKSLLQSLIDIQGDQKLSNSGPPTALLILCGLIMGLILIPWSINQYYSRVYRGIEARTTNAWANLPQLALYSLNAEVKKGSLILTGRVPNQNLRNQAAEIAEKQASIYNLELDNQIVAVEVQPDPSQVSGEVERITKVLNQQSGVSITSNYIEGRVILEGRVIDITDIQKIIGIIEEVPGVRTVISTIKLSPLELKTRIYFDPGSAKLQPNYVDKIVEVKEFMNQYPEKYLRIIGHTDSTGNPDINQKLAIERANTVRNALVEQGVDAGRLEVTGQTNPPQDVEDNQPLFLSRCVTFDLLEEIGEDN